MLYTHPDANELIPQNNIIVNSNFNFIVVCFIKLNVFVYGLLQEIRYGFPP